MKNDGGRMGNKRKEGRLYRWNKMKDGERQMKPVEEEEGEEREED